MYPTRIASGLASIALLSVVGCSDDPVSPDSGADPGPAPASPDRLLVLNSTGQTLASFELGEMLVSAGGEIDLGAGFDGVSLDATADHAVTTVSSFGGSRVLFVDLVTGGVQTTTFLPAAGFAVNPSRPTFDEDGTTAYFAGRGSNSVYAASPGAIDATEIALNVGSFVERVIPVGNRLFALDANIDDDGGTFAPFGPSRVFAIEGGVITATIDLPPTALNAIDMVRVGERLVVLLGGTFDPATFAPNGDGGLVTISLSDFAVGPVHGLAGNGVSIEAGADGLVYVTATGDFVSLDAMSFDAAADAFVDGPSGPLDIRDAGGARVDCWALTALSDGRRACITFSFASDGRLIVVDAMGSFVGEIPSGFGSTDILLR